MAPHKKVPKELYYKQATFLNPQDETLQHLIRLARASHSAAHERECEIGGNTVLWNNHTSRGDMDLGMLHSFEKGKSQLILATATSVNEYQIKESPPPQSAKAGEKHEYNDGLLFFGIYKNNVILLQSANLKVSKLTEYLNWLITKGDHFPIPNRIELQDPTPRNLREVDAPPLKSIKILSPFALETEAPADQSGKKKRVAKKDLKVKVAEKSWAPIKAFLESVGAIVPDDLNFNGYFKPSLVELSIELKWKGREKDRDKTPVLDTVLHAFQDMDDPPIKAITSTGSEITGNSLRTRKQVLVTCQGKQPVYQDVYAHMQEYLAELLESGEAIP